MSTAAAGATGAGDAGQAQGQQGEAGNGGVDIGALTGQFDQLRSSHDETRQMLQDIASRLPQQQEGQQDEGAEDAPMDLSFLEQYASDPAYEPEQVAQQLQSVFDQRLQQGIEAAVKPLQQQMQEAQRERDAEAFAAEFPEVLEGNNGELLFQETARAAEMIGRPELAKDFKFARLVYMAARAADEANGEGSSDPQAAHLEGGAGASPGGSAQVDLAQQILNGGDGPPQGRAAFPWLT